MPPGPTTASLSMATALARARAALEPELAAEVEHPVYHRTLVDWDGSASLDRLRVNVGSGWMEQPLPWLVEAKNWRLELVGNGNKNLGLEKIDPLTHAWECPTWRLTDLRMARKRLEHPGVVLELLVTGGIRSGKTFGCTRRVMANFCYTEDAKIWVLDETEITSKRWHQKEVEHFLPADLKPDSGKAKKDKTTQFSYNEGTGFTGNMFNIHWRSQNEAGVELNGGGMWEHRFYGADIGTLQGAELTCANSDELVPKAICDSVRERLLSRAQESARPDFLARIRQAIAILESGGKLPVPLLGAIYHGVHFISFTPKEGYSSTVADFMDGALTVDITDTKILPDGVGLHRLPPDFVEKWQLKGQTGEPVELLPGKTVPRFKQPKKPTRLIAYFHTYDNPFKGNWPGMVADCVGKTEDEIRILAYGDVSKNWSTQFGSLFRDEHHVLTDRAAIPRSGTFRLIIDPARVRPWACSVELTTVDKRSIVVREWPQEGSSIPGFGDPGAWAVVSRTGKKNGDRGPAQELAMKWTTAQYNRELWRLRMEIGAWWLPGTTPKQVLEWKDRPDWRLEGCPIPVYETILDCRFARQAIGGKDLFEEMEECENPQTNLIPSAGADLEDGDQLIIDALGSYNAAAPLGPMNCPRLQFWHECHGMFFMLRNFSLDPFRENTKATDEACKDFRDLLAMARLNGPTHVDAAKGGWQGGGSF